MTRRVVLIGRIGEKFNQIPMFDVTSVDIGVEDRAGELVTRFSACAPRSSFSRMLMSQVLDSEFRRVARFRGEGFVAGKVEA